MEPVTTALIGGSIVSGLVGAFAGMSAQDRAEAMRDKALQEWLKVRIPDPAAQKLALEEFIVAGKLTPELEQAIKQDPSAFEKVSENSRLKSSRMRALKHLENLGTGGETFEDRAAQQEALIDATAKARGAQKAIVSELEQRGQLGTTNELLARMDQGQSDADQMSRNALTTERDRRARAFKAIESAGSMAGDIADDEYRMNSDKAKAADIISSFNTRNKQDVLSRNVAARNRANEYNLNNEQDVANKNTSMRNFREQYNKELDQKRFDNEATVAAGRSGQYAQGANQAIQSGQNAAQFWGNLAGNVPKVGTAISRMSKTADDDEEKLVDGDVSWGSKYA